jgi:hypothetical protein
VLREEVQKSRRTSLRKVEA